MKQTARRFIKNMAVPIRTAAVEAERVDPQVSTLANKSFYRITCIGHRI